MLERLMSAWTERAVSDHVPSVVNVEGSLAHPDVKEFARRVEAQGGLVLSGMWRPGVHRPYGGIAELIDGLAGHVLSSEPVLVRSYGLGIANLLPTYQETAGLGEAQAFRSGLAEFVFRGDREGLAEFYWRRDSSSFLISELLRLTLDATSALAGDEGPAVVLCLENHHLAAPQERMWIELLASYGIRRRSFLLCLAGEPSTDESPFAELEGSDRELGRVLQASSALLLPFRVGDLERLLGEEGPADLAAAVRDLKARGDLRSAGLGRYAPAHFRGWSGAYESMGPEQRKELHLRASAIEALDPFASAWHALQTADSDQIYQKAGQALRRAWGLSALQEAQPLAEHFLHAAAEPSTAADESRRSTPNGDLLMGMISYDAGEFEDADFYLSRLLESSEPGVQEATLRRLIGYNAIFGLNQLSRGRELLEASLPRFESLGLHREAASVRNSIAYTLFRQGRAEEAVAMEDSSIELLRKSGSGAGLLLALLQLNIGRLFRVQGSTEKALASFRSANRDAGSDFTPYLLQLLRASLAHLHLDLGQWDQVFRELHHCLQISRDFSGESASYPALRLLASTTSELPAGSVTRGDEVFLYLYANLAIASGKLGLEERAEVYFQGIRKQWGFLGEVIEEFVAQTSKLAAEPAEADAEGQDGQTAEGFQDDLRHLTEHYSDLLQRVDTPSPFEQAAEMLAQGKSLAVVLPIEHQGRVLAVDSLLLCDPRDARLAAKLSREFNIYSAPKLRSLICTADCDVLGSGSDPGVSLLLQNTSLKADQREHLAGLAPYNLRAQVVSAQQNESLLRILQAFSARTGLELLASASFLVFGHDLASSPDTAMSSFLMSSADYLLFDDLLFTKKHGAEAATNLLPFRPRISLRASVHQTVDPDSGKDQLVLAIRSSSSRRLLRLNQATKAILDASDGTRTVAEIVEQLGPQFSSSPDLAGQVGDFLRSLYQQRAICFEPGLGSGGRDSKVEAP